VGGGAIDRDVTEVSLFDGELRAMKAKLVVVSGGAESSEVNLELPVASTLTESPPLVSHDRSDAHLRKLQ